MSGMDLRVALAMSSLVEQNNTLRDEHARMALQVAEAQTILADSREAREALYREIAKRDEELFNLRRRVERKARRR